MEKFNLFSEVGAFFSKWATIIFSIGIGVLAKISTELLLKRKLSMVQWIGIMGVSIFGGYMMAAWCHNKGWLEQSCYLVPLATLFSEKVMIYITTNYRAIIDRIVDAFFKKKE